MTASPVPRGSVAWVARAVQVRLRFVIVLAVTCLVVGRWETLRTYWDKVARAALGGATVEQAVSSDTEYFCPMDPGVVTDWPGRCGVCNMALVRRKRGEATPLPSGVVARMQLSPERLQLAGVRTATVTYRPLTRDLALVGTVTGDSATVEADVFDKDVPLLSPGLAAEVVVDGPGGAETFPAEVREVIPRDASRRARARVAVEGPADALRPGASVTVRVRRPVADFEPFRSLPSDPPPPRKGEPRAVYLCPAHAELLRDAPGKCPIDGLDTLERRPLQPNQRVGWWCPMHPNVTADRQGQSCKECGGMALAPRVVTYRPAGQVLAVDGSAVVDTGTRTVVFVERMPGMFDGVEVKLGPRCGDAYPVASGLEPGQRVATSGAFLLDAETRLNPSLAASYFGARVAGAPAPAPTVDRPVCPVTGKPLGSMGPPVRVVVNGRTVLLCCDGCEDKLRKDPDRYLSKKP
jgi:Cu(I)/Ag(I) efflux system membrane fusion protein